LLVGHVEDADRANADATAGEGRIADEHERIERIAVLAERSLDVAVVRGIAHRGEEAPVEDDPTELLVELILVPRPGRNLDVDHTVAHVAKTTDDARTPTRPRHDGGDRDPAARGRARAERR